MLYSGNPGFNAQSYIVVVFSNDSLDEIKADNYDAEILIQRKKREIIERKDTIVHNQDVEFGHFTESGIIISHRGLPYPENTMTAIEQSINDGAKIIEIDVAFTKDDIPVLIHDTSINRTGRNIDGSMIETEIHISDICYSELRNYDFGIAFDSKYSGERIPKLEEALDYLYQFNCNAIIDLTGHTYSSEEFDILHDLFKKYNMINHIALNCYSSQAQTYTSKYSDTPLNITNSIDTYMTMRYFYDEYKQKTPLFIASGNEQNLEDSSNAFFEYAHDLGIVTVLGFIENREEAELLFNAGCDMIYSENIKQLEMK